MRNPYDTSNMFTCLPHALYTIAHNALYCSVSFICPALYHLGRSTFLPCYHAHNAKDKRKQCFSYHAANTASFLFPLACPLFVLAFIYLQYTFCLSKIRLVVIDRYLRLPTRFRHPFSTPFSTTSFSPHKTTFTSFLRSLYHSPPLMITHK